MDKKIVENYILDTGYKVGYGALKHFSTYDIVSKFPVIVSILTLTIGISAIIFPIESIHMNLTLIFVGVIGFYVSNSEYNSNKDKYLEIGKRLNGELSKLRTLYCELQSADEDNAIKIYNSTKEIDFITIEISIANHILLSGVYTRIKIWNKQSMKWLKKHKR